MADLAALQRQFYDHVVGGAEAAPPIATGNLAVYADMYAVRLADALADDYPKLRRALGDNVFAAVVQAYLRAHPPRSFTLRDAGAALPAWIRSTALAPPWAADLAALERARVEVFDAVDAAALTQAEAIALGDALPELIVRWVPACVLVDLNWSVDELWSAIEDAPDEPSDAPHPATETHEPAAGPCAVRVWRHELSVLHRMFDDDERALASSMITGARFAEICEQLAGTHGPDAGARATELLLRWLAGGVLVSPVDAPRDLARVL